MAYKIWSTLTRHPWWTALAVAALLAAFPVLPMALAWPARVLLVVLCMALGARLLAKLRAAARAPKTAIFGLAALLASLGFAYGLVELASWIYLQKVPLSGDPFVMTERQKKYVRFVVNESEGYQVYSPSLAWTIGKNQAAKDGLYRSNADGFRANREYAKEKPPGKIRVLCFGDSYTHGDEVGNEETWEHQAEQAAPDMEFLNFGVPGFSLTQAYVRYKEVARSYDADYVIIGCMTEDLKRSVNVYYPFRYANPEDSPNAAAMPYASLNKAGDLVVQAPAIASREKYAAFLEKPLPMLKKMSRVDLLFRPPPPTPFLALLADRWRSHDRHLDPLVNYARASWHRAFHSSVNIKHRRNPDAARNAERKRRISEIGRLLFARFALEVKKSGAVPVILWFPSPMNLDSHNAGRARDYQHYFDFFAKRDLAAVDTLDWLVEIAGEGNPLPVDTLLTGEHFSATTNAHVGRRIADFIRVLDKESKLE
jgi:hypothetical protein